MQTGLESIRILRIQDSRRRRRLILISAAAFMVVLLFSLCVRTSEAGLVPLGQALDNLWTWLRLTWADIFDLPLWLERNDIIAQHPFYLETVGRFKITVITMVCGAILALSGSIYQGVFRNPMAAPTMLGVSTGVNLGLILLVLQYGGLAISMTTLRYEYCYGFAILMLVIVLAAGKIVGRRKTSVTDMLLVGSVMSQLVGVIITYIRFDMESDVLLVYQQLNMGVYMNIEDITFIVLLGAVLIGVVPIHLMRFSMNAICFADEDSYSLGINPRAMRIIALICGTVLITAAMIHCGNIGMLSLITPHLCRYMFGSNFKSLYYASAAMGAMLMLVCRDISSMIYFAGDTLPISTIVSLLTTPIFVIVLLKQRRGWE